MNQAPRSDDRVDVASRLSPSPRTAPRAFWRTTALAVLLASCSDPVGDTAPGTGPHAGAPTPSQVGSVSQALIDTDADGLDDDWEMLHFGDLSQGAADDISDSDGMTNQRTASTPS